MTSRTAPRSVEPITGLAWRAFDLWSNAAARCRRFASALSDPYRPEAHYMRGPGPKWYAKHGHETGTGR